MNLTELYREKSADGSDWVRSDGDPGRIAKKALTNMVMEKAIDYHEPKPEFMQI